ncbi:MAG: response regulator [Clostridia bacterium]|nr:response regulator [Clostridia bacterium]
MKIMAIDDERAALNVLCSAIREAEPEAEIAAFQSPAEALKHAQESAFDVVFLDISMYEMNGLELARRLKELHPHLNFIFVTGYGEYAGEAISIRASGYLQKPVTAEDVSEELRNLRYPLPKERAMIEVQTFGHFELFVHGRMVSFPRAKSKELLAYLVDRRGAGVSRKEIAAVLFEDKAYTRSTQDYVNHVISDLLHALKAVHAEQMIIRSRNSIAVDVECFACDRYDYERGDVQGLNAFRGEYMAQYSWASETEALFYR